MNIFSNLFSWLIFGSIIASFAYMIEPRLRNKKPFVYGITGAILTGLITNYFLNIPLEQFSLVSLMVAVFGASFLVISTGFFRRV